MGNVSCVILGDINIDMNRWDNPDTRHTKLVEDTKETVEAEDFEQVIVGSTRFFEGQAESLIDHCWVNRPEKVLETKKHLPCSVRSQCHPGNLQTQGG